VTLRHDSGEQARCRQCAPRQPLIILEYRTSEKLAGRIYTGKREFIGFSVHNGANAGRDYTLEHKKIFVNESSTALSVIVE
jgi:hypothetical protein